MERPVSNVGGSPHLRGMAGSWEVAGGVKRKVCMFETLRK